MALRTLPQQLLDARGVVVAEDRRAAVGALHLRALLLEDVAREGMPSLDLALGGQLEALLRARVGLHLRHGERDRIAQAPRRRPSVTTKRPSGRSPSSRAAWARRPLASAPGNAASAAATGGSGRSAGAGGRSAGTEYRGAWAG